MRSDLLQSNINGKTVTNAYTNYFDGFSKLSQLVIADAYKAPVKDEDTGEITDTLFFFGRTNTEPYTYYYRSSKKYFSGANPNPLYWTPWQKIEITINSPVVTPVYVFDRLFLLWVESERKIYTKVAGGTATEEYAYIDALKFSFYNHLKQWVQPQTVANKIVADYVPDSYSIPLMIDPTLIDPDAPYYRKPYAIAIPPKVIPPVGGGVATVYPERLGVWLGAVYRLPIDPVTVPAPPNKSAMNPDKYQFEYSIYDTGMRVNGAIARNNSREGYILLNQVGSLRSSLLTNVPQSHDI